MHRNKWNRLEQLLALRLYCTLPFGKLHQTNSDVISLAENIGRTPSAVAMKACNFASLDPALERKGLGNVSRADRELWQQFQEDSESVAVEIETAYADVEETKPSHDSSSDISVPKGATEMERTVRVRRVQRFFRNAVMVSYGYRCALSGLSIPDLLIASHIIPWKDDEKRRADPANGIALNALYDRAFDQGYISFDERYQVMISNTLRLEMAANDSVQELFKIKGKMLILPERFIPDAEAMKYHRENIYKG